MIRFIAAIALLFQASVAFGSISQDQPQAAGAQTSVESSDSVATESAVAQTASTSAVTITVKPGASDYTSDLQNVFANAPAGATIHFLSGTYPVPNGTTFVLKQSLNLVGDPSTLVNVRILALANISISGLNFNEKDCVYKSTNPSACPVMAPMISIGAANYPITKATINKVNLNFSRAYTGIAFGFGTTSNVTISNFAIVDNELSGITALGGTNITITNGSITGGTDANVDDGIALYSAAGELSNVTVSNIKSNNNFDAVGIGALLYYPMHDITVKTIQCRITAVCIYLKAGDQAPVPSQYAGYSTMERVTVNGVNDQDLKGVRYLSTVWLYAKGGAKASAITVTNVNATTRSASASTPRVWTFTDAKSTISNVEFTNMTFVDNYQAAAADKSHVGLPTAEGVFLEDLGQGNISTLSVGNVNVNGTSYYAIDSSLATVAGLSISTSQFQHINQAQPSVAQFVIPYEYVLDGKAVGSKK